MIDGRTSVIVQPAQPDARALNQKFEDLGEAREYAQRLSARRGWPIDDRAPLAAGTVAA